MAYLDFEEPIARLQDRIDQLRKIESTENVDVSKAISDLELQLNITRKEVYESLSRWQKVQLSRHPDRPYTLFYIQEIFDSFTELHGDRYFGDDKAIVGGFAKLNGKPVMVIGHQKGFDTKSRQYRNFGMANPEGYRKALRLMKMAEKFEMPVICFIDTPGAYPGIEGEQRGQAEAIARNLFEMAQLKTPIICTIIGEGASGGAIGIGLGDKILMLQNTWYSVISPESCSSILWGTWDNKEIAAEQLQLTAEDMKSHGLIDEIVEEPIGGAHYKKVEMAKLLKARIEFHLDALFKVDVDSLLENRVAKYSKMGALDVSF